MTEVVLYHHVQGLTDGVRSFADELREAGHTVHTPDLFDGRTFGTIEEGMAFARETGFGALFERGVAAARGNLPRVRLRRLLHGSGDRPAARPDPVRSTWGPAHVLVLSRLGVRGRVARGRPCAGARQGGRRVLRGGPAGRPRTRRLDRPRRAVPLPGGAAPVRRLLAPGLRPAAAALLTERVLAFLAAGGG